MLKNVSADQTLYLRHRKRVLEARSNIDNKPPLEQASNFLRMGKLKEDASTYMKMMRLNTQLLVKLNKTMRTHGLVNTFRSVRRASFVMDGSIRKKNNDLRVLEKENVKIGMRLLCTKGVLNTRRPLTDEQKRSRRERESLILPHNILSKYEHLKLPSSVDEQRRLLRPKIYIDLAVKGIRSLGRITIQLYTEASPQVVLEFMRICTTQSKDQMKLIRLFPMLWIEGALNTGPLSVLHNNLEYDMRALDHGNSKGILSYSACHLKGFKHNCINFSISLKPLRVLNGRRVAFGCVLRGLKILDCIQDFGTKNGKPTKEIVIIGCGVCR